MKHCGFYLSMGTHEINYDTLTTTTSADGQLRASVKVWALWCCYAISPVPFVCECLFCLYAFLLWDDTSRQLNQFWIWISTRNSNWQNFNSPLFIRVPSFTTRGVEEDEADEAKDFGTDVDMGAEDAPERGDDSLLMIGESKNNYCLSLPNNCPKDILYCTEHHNNCTLLTV